MKSTIMKEAHILARKSMMAGNNYIVNLSEGLKLAHANNKIYTVNFKTARGADIKIEYRKEIYYIDTILGQNIVEYKDNVKLVALYVNGKKYTNIFNTKIKGIECIQFGKQGNQPLVVDITKAYSEIYGEYNAKIEKAVKKEIEAMEKYEASKSKVYAAMNCDY